MGALGARKRVVWERGTTGQEQLFHCCSLAVYCNMHGAAAAAAAGLSLFRYNAIVNFQPCILLTHLPARSAHQLGH